MMDPRTGVEPANGFRQQLKDDMDVQMYECILYCIISIHLYSALAVHTNQKRFQCERPREKRAVLRVRKEALGSPFNKVDRIERRSWFQGEGPMFARARVGAIEVLARGTKRS